MTESYFNQLSELFDELASSPPAELEAFLGSILECWERGGTVYSFGNGGSATDSLHFTTELVARFRDRPIERPAVSLNANPASLTAIPNDWSFSEVFERQVRSSVTSEDVVLGISTSGNSENVKRGLDQAHEIGAECYGLTGQTGGDMASDPYPIITVPATRTAHVQEAHIACLHRVCDQVDQRLNS